MVWERLAALLGLGLGVLAWVLSSGLPKADGPGPELFPRILGTVLVLAGLYLFLAPARGPNPAGEGSGGWKAGLLFLLFLASPLLVPRLGLAPSAALVAGLATLVYGETWPRALLVALGIWALAYGVFVRLLGVPA
ncbi:tripartite tricarboxylate transporter TctB family protein [Thermus igniterrae]|jgi:putative tricarboxylic transport membrane protein|uniref:tripartite tricarboxylate transporter TctB family protein n=1 Tax=Thermus igniterrae TaxID=88189 RepID=UPI000381D723|nr:tripartite tricarboxylate transporter TctB family protein [Thermus igniterrae]